MGHALQPHESLRAEDLEAETAAGGRHCRKVPGHARLHAKQHRGGVVGIHGHDAPEALTIHLVDLAAEIDHAVDRVNPHGRQAAAGCFVPARPPGVRRQEQRIGECHVGFEVQNLAEFSGSDLLSQSGHFRMQAAVISKPEGHAGLFGRRHRPLGGRLAQREGFLAEDMLAGLRGRHYLVGVYRMGSGQYNGVDFRIVEGFRVVVDERQSMLPGKRFELLRRASGDTGDKPDLVACAGDGLDQSLSPPTHTDDGGIDHHVLPRCCGVVSCARIISLKWRVFNFYRKTRLCVAGIVLDPATPG